VLKKTMTSGHEPIPSSSGAQLLRVPARLKSVLSYAADLILSPVCCACREPVMAHNSLCPHCWTQVQFITHPLCDRLGVPLAFAADGHNLSAQALAAPPVYDRARAACAYSGVARDLVHAFKYADRLEMLALFVRWMTAAGRDLLADADVLVPVPLHPLRLLRRRFNQSSMLALRLGRIQGIKVCQGLQRVRRTRQQVGLNSAERRNNVADAFRLSRAGQQAISGRHVVLVDDIITTGATVDACAQVLRAGGAMRVDVLAIARVVETELLDG
jgi:ComF family protein